MADIRKRTGPAGTSWQVRYRKPGGYGYKSFATKREARTFVEGLGQVVDREDDSDLTVADAIREWLDTVQRHGRHGREPVGRDTLRKYEERSRNHLIPLVGSLLLSEFTPPRGVRLRKDLLDRCSRATAKKCLTDLKGALAEARLRGEMAIDPLADVQIVDSQRRQRRVVIPTRAEMRQIESRARERRDAVDRRVSDPWARFYPMLMTLRWAGLRPSEMRALRDDDIRWEEGALRVVQGASERGEIDRPKTINAIRTIHVPAILLDALADWITIRGATRSLTFPTESGRPMSLSNLSGRAWADVAKDLPLTLYGLRHFRISERLAAGENIHVVSEEAGHADAGFTLRVYGHVVRDGLA